MKALEYAEGLDHVMEFTKLRVLNALFSMIHQTIRNVYRYNQTHPDFPMEVQNSHNLSFSLLVFTNTVPILYNIQVCTYLFYTHTVCMHICIL